MATESIFVEIGAAVRGTFTSAIASTKSSLVELNNLATGVGMDGQGLDLAIETHKKLRSEIAGEVAEATALGFTMFNLIKPAIAFESAFADVQKVIQGTDSEVSALRQNLKDMALDMPTSAEGLAAIAAEGAKVGVVAKDLDDFTTAVSVAATAMDLLPSQAGEAFAIMSNVFGIPITEIGRVSDTVNYLSNSIAATPEAIINASKRIGGVAKTLGLTADQAIGLSGAFISVGMAPQVAATSINSMLTRLLTLESLGKDGEKAMQSLGFSVSEFSEMLHTDAESALRDFLVAVGDLSSEEQVPIIADLFGRENVRSITLMASGIDIYNDAMAKVRDDARIGSAMAEYDNVAATTANTLRLLVNNIRGVALAFGDALLPVVNTVAWGFIYLLRPLIWTLETFWPLSTVIGTVVGAMVALRVASAAYNLVAFVTKGVLLDIAKGHLGAAAGATVHQRAMSGLYSTVVNFPTILSQMGQSGKLAMTLLAQGTRALFVGGLLSAGPIVWAIVAGVAALTYAGIKLYQYWEPLKSLFSGFGSTFMQDADFGFLTDQLDRLGSALAKVFTAMGFVSAETEEWGIVGEAVGYALTKVFEVLGVVIGGALESVIQIVDGISSVLGWFSSTPSTGSPTGKKEPASTVDKGADALNKKAASSVAAANAAVAGSSSQTVVEGDVVVQVAGNADKDTVQSIAEAVDAELVRRNRRRGATMRGNISVD